MQIFENANSRQLFNNANPRNYLRITIQSEKLFENAASIGNTDLR